MNFRPNTILVLGAGASKDFGLPLGIDLRQKIETELDVRFDDWGSQLKKGSPVVVDAFRLLAGEDDPRRDINPFLHASWEISAAMPLCSSIDDYLEKHQGIGLYESCGKLAIAKCILESERGSILYNKRSDGQEVRPSVISSSWMTGFMQTATRGIRRSDIGKAFDDLLVVNFNYDRCFETFAYLWLRTAYRLEESEAIEVVKKIRMVRPYGSLGPLPWHHGEPGVGFGASATAANLVQMTARIRTYSESANDPAISKTIMEHLHESRCIVFMGFAFHRQNMKFFEIGGEMRPFVRHIFACTYGIPDPRWELIKGKIEQAVRTPQDMLFANTLKGDCREFWEEYSDNIAA